MQAKPLAAVTSDSSAEFEKCFFDLTGNEPFAWQARLYREFCKPPIEWPAVIDLPAGLGKTMVMAIWLIARAKQGRRIPLRLLYVVERRTAIDHATDLAKKLQDQFSRVFPALGGLAIATLRGEQADNRDWSRDLSSPAIIIGTTDLIGSRLLFSGYRSGFIQRPLEAGLLGQDSLLLLDDAHLSRPFDQLLSKIVDFQRADPFPLKVIRLSATSLYPGSGRFVLEKSDLSDRTMDQRYHAKKSMKVVTAIKVNDAIAQSAAATADSHPGSRIVLFVKTLTDAESLRRAIVANSSTRAPKIAILTESMRGLERDELVTPPTNQSQHERRVMQRFLTPKNLPSLGECFLISTGAGEVGVDLQADHLVGDAAPLDSWIQRIGRVNRRGGGDATVTLIQERTLADQSDLEKACTLTSKLLASVSDVSPRALAELTSKLNTAEVKALSTPESQSVELTDVLLDAWSMTSLFEPMPGRPAVGPWLCGADEHVSQTTIAWRAELDEPGFANLNIDTLEEWFASHRLLTHETLAVSTPTAVKQLLTRWSCLSAADRASLAARMIVVNRAGPEPMALAELMKCLEAEEKQTKRTYDTLRFAQLILPASFGGIERGKGMLDARYPGLSNYTDKNSVRNLDKESGQVNEDQERLANPDVADVAPGQPRMRQIITTSEGGEQTTRTIGNGTMPSTPAITRVALFHGDDKTIYLVSYVPCPEKPEIGSQKQSLRQHVDSVRKAIDQLLGRLHEPEATKIAAEYAADYHDHGKNRERWQRTVSGEASPVSQDWKAATVGTAAFEMKCDPRGYRHEFGSLREFEDVFHNRRVDDESQISISAESFDLAMHLIAAHHGRGRPHFPQGAFDPSAESRSPPIHAAAIQRFARLQGKLGWWRLAWLESLLRCADALAIVSTPMDESKEGEE